MRHSLIAFMLFIVPAGSVAAGEPFYLRGGERIVFLGDSNTYAGGFIAYLDTYLTTRFPDKKFELINLGLPSETVSGLSEADHPYPRPDVHERLDRALAQTKPDVVVICYGMNDGIYSPFSKERFAKYREGMHQVIDRVRKAGAKVILHTPAPFDPLPLRGKVQPATAAKFSWLKPYKDYDQVLTRYSDWLLTLRGKGLIVADPHTAIRRYLSAVRKSDPQYVISADGIHPNATGHWLIAQEILRAWHAPAEVDTAEINVATSKKVRGKIEGLEVNNSEIRLTWRTRLPLPADPRWRRGLAEEEKISDRLNQQRLIVLGVPHERYELFEGDRRLGEVTRKELTGGLDMTRFADLSTNRRSAESGKLVEKRQRLLGLAWLTAVGHKRPDTPKGLALKEAQRQAAQLEVRIRELTQPVSLHLRLLRRAGR